MNEKAIDIMTTPPYRAKETDTVKDVIERFVKYRISGMPVVNDRNEMIGYISDGDIMRYVGRHRDIVIDLFFYQSYMKGDAEAFDLRTRQLEKVNVMEIAKRKVVKVQWDTDVEDIAAILGEKKIKKVPVERDGVLIGIISRGDVIRHIYKTYLS